MGARNINVLIVDDSVVFRSQIKASLSNIPKIKVVGTASNGRIALAKLIEFPVDLMTLDIEMPELNGIETLKEMRRKGHKTKVIVFSSKTAEGGAMGLEALRSGADDVLAKPTGEGMSIENAAKFIGAELIPKIFQFNPENSKPLEETKKEESPPRRKDINNFKPKVIVIGASTGGPVAIEKIFSGLKGNLQIPILVTQHMPPVFTKCLANRLKDLTGFEVDEGKNGELLKNKIYIAPGNYHMTLVKSGEDIRIKLDQGPPQNMVRPAVDPLFESAATLYGSNCMGFILTGMGEDGSRGAQALKAAGGGVVIQNRESCVVFGMPGAVFKANAYDAIESLEDIRNHLHRMTIKESSK